MAHYFAQNRTRVYLLDEWYKNVAIVKIKQGPIFVVGEGLSPEKIKNALYKIGHRHADAVLLTETKPSKFKYEELTSKIVHPFEDIWPAQTVGKFGPAEVSIQWGIHVTKEGRIWYNTGYSGSKKDDVSYCFKVGEKPAFCIGAGARFVLSQGKVISSQANRTLEVKL